MRWRWLRIRALGVVLGVAGAAGCALPPGRATPPSPFDDGLAAAWSRYEADRPRAAAEEFRHAAGLAASPEELGRALAGEAQAWERAGEPARALACWEEAAQRLAGHPFSLRARYQAARLLFEALGRPDEGLARLEVLIREAPGAVQAPRALRRLTMARPPGVARLDWLAAAYAELGQGPLGVPLLELCAGEALAQALPERALACWQTLVAEHPDSNRVDDALLAAADLEAGRGRLEAARDLYRTLATAPPSRDPYGPFPSGHVPRALLALGEVEVALGAPDAARRAWRTLAARHPSSRLADDALAALGRLESALGRHAAARTAWRSLLTRYPDSSWADEAAAALR